MKGRSEVSRKLLKKNQAKLKAWEKFLMADEEWDSWYLFRIMHFKLRRMRRYFETSKITPDSPKVAKEIERVETLLGNCLQEVHPYAKEHKEKLESKYGKMKRLNMSRKETTFGLNYRWGKLDQSASDRVTRIYFKVINRSEQIREKELTLALALIAKHHGSWWD